LSFYSVLGGTVEALDAQMLFDSLEEQLDLPAATIELSGERRQVEVFVQKRTRNQVSILQILHCRYNRWARRPTYSSALFTLVRRVQPKNRA
jgi:hypothetical protein